MKKLLLFLAVLIGIPGFGAIDTTTVKSKIINVTVFFHGAQITREADITLKKGKFFLLVDNLPIELNDQSIQVHKIEGCKILSVKYLITYGQENKKSKEETDIENQIKLIEQKGQEIQNKLTVFDMEEKLLIDNSILRKKDDGSNVNEIRSAADFYRARLNEIHQSKLELSLSIDDLKEKEKNLYLQMNKIVSKKKNHGQVIISLESNLEQNSKLTVNYYIPSAGWEPMYDFRVEDVSQPLTLVYNANVFQSSGEDWNNVNIRLSNNNPSLNGQKPELAKWVFGQKQETRQPVVIKSLPGGGSAALKGKVTDKATNEPICFANVIVESDGNQIGGAITDFDGNYTIKPLPPGLATLRVSYVGYEPLASNVVIQTDKISFQNLAMNPQTTSLQEVEIVNYKIPLISKDQTVSGGTISGEDLPGNAHRYRGSSSSNYSGTSYQEKPEPVTVDLIGNSLKTNVTGLEYQIDIPYTILSDGTDNTLKIKETTIPVNYLYHAIPKLDPDAFLSAEITDWSKLNLMTGKSSIYFRGTFVGESWIDIATASDTITFSLGHDKNIFVKRDVNKSLMEKKILSSSIKEHMGWEITLRNNTKSKARIILEDQYPVSDKKWIEVELLGSTGAKNDEKAGKLTWEINLEPNETKKVNFDFTVKYPN